MKNRLLSALMTCLIAMQAWPEVGLANAYDALPGGPLRKKYGLYAETWRERLQVILRDEPEALRKHFEEVLCSYAVKPRDVRVQIAPTTPNQLREGFFPHVVFEFHDGQFDTGRVAHLFADMRNIQINYEELLLFDRIRFLKPGKVEYLLEIRESDLNRAIFDAGDKKLSIKNPHIELRRDSIRLTGRVPHMLGSTNVRVDGSMKVVGSKINFQPSSLKLSVLPMPGFVAREIFQRINPIADLDKLKMDARPDQIVSRTDRLFVLTRGMRSELDKESP